MSDLITTSEHLVTQTAPRSEGAVSPLQRPEFFRLPKSGVDPFFGLGRSYYYEGEKLGNWRLVRIRQRGKLRGVTLVPYDGIAGYIRKQAQAQSGRPTPARKAGYARMRMRSDKTTARSYRRMATVSTCENGAATGGRR